MEVLERIEGFIHERTPHQHIAINVHKVVQAYRIRNSVKLFRMPSFMRRWPASNLALPTDGESFEIAHHRHRPYDAVTRAGRQQTVPSLFPGGTLRGSFWSSGTLSMSLLKTASSQVIATDTGSGMKSSSRRGDKTSQTGHPFRRPGFASEGILHTSIPAPHAGAVCHGSGRLVRRPRREDKARS